MLENNDYTDIPESRITQINRALIKFFVACGISFRIVEHPFFINFVKELNAEGAPVGGDVFFTFNNSAKMPVILRMRNEFYIVLKEIKTK